MIRLNNFIILLSLVAISSGASGQSVLVRMTEGVDSTKASSGQSFHGTVVSATQFDSGQAIPAGSIVTTKLLQIFGGRWILRMESIQVDGNKILVSNKSMGQVAKPTGEDFSQPELVTLANRGIISFGPKITFGAGTVLKFEALADNSGAETQLSQGRSTNQVSGSGDATTTVDGLILPITPPKSSNDRNTKRPYFYRNSYGEVTVCFYQVPQGAAPTHWSCKHSSEAEAQQVLNGSLHASAPPTTPINVHDPTGFDVMGLKLYMSAVAAQAVLAKRFGQVAMNRSCSRQVPPCIVVHQLQDQVKLPGSTVSTPVAPKYVSSIDFRSEDGTVLNLTFVGAAPSYHLNQPEILVDIQYTAKAPTTADEIVILNRLKERYGQPLARSIRSFSPGQGAGDDQGYIWVLDAENCDKKGSSEECSYPQLTTILKSPDMSFDLRAPVRFADEYAWEIGQKKQQMIGQSNLKTTVTPVF